MSLVKKISITLSLILAAIPVGAQTNAATKSRDAEPVVLNTQELPTLGDTYADIVAKFGPPTIEFPLAGGDLAVWYDHSKFILKGGKVSSYELLDPAGAKRALAQRKQNAAQFKADTASRREIMNKLEREMEARVAAERKAEMERIAREKQEREARRIAAELKRLKQEQEKQALRGRWAQATNAAGQQGVTYQLTDTLTPDRRDQSESARPLDEIRFDLDSSVQSKDDTNSYIQIQMDQYGGSEK